MTFWVTLLAGFLFGYILTLLGLTSEEANHGILLTSALGDFHHHLFPVIVGCLSSALLWLITKKEKTLAEIREQFNQVTEQSPSVYELYDIDGLQIEVNKAYEDLWQFPEGRERTIRKFNVLKSKEVEETGLLAHVKKAYAGETVTLPPYKFDPTGETEAKGVGRVRWLSTKIYPLKNKTDEVANIVIRHEDISERMEAEGLLRESEKRFRAFYADTPVPFHSLDSDGNLLEVNPAWLNLLGYEKGEVLGKHYGEFMHPDWKPHFELRFPEFKRFGIVRDVHFKLRHKDEHYVDISLCGSISKDTDGTFKNTNCVLTDITARMQAEEERSQMETQAIRAAQLATLGELSAGVAHEINNPISGVINYAQLILNKTSKGSSEEDLSKRIMKEGERIASIVSKLLLFSRKEEGEHRLHDIRELVDVPISLVGKKLENDGIIVDFSIDKNIAQVNCNAQQIEQVLLNLISNAQFSLNKKSTKSYKGKKIHISAQEVMKEEVLFMLLEVEDFGAGIPKEVLPNIFNAFYTTKEAGVGTGLGLSISENIIKLHDGQIRIDSEEGTYTKVSIELPISIVP